MKLLRRHHFTIPVYRLIKFQNIIAIFCSQV